MAGHAIGSVLPRLIRSRVSRRLSRIREPDDGGSACVHPDRGCAHPTDPCCRACGRDRGAQPPRSARLARALAQADAQPASEHLGRSAPRFGCSPTSSRPESTATSTGRRRATSSGLPRAARSTTGRAGAGTPKAPPPIPPVPASRSLKVGTLLAREHGGQLHRVTVVADGFAWNGATYTSLVRDRASRSPAHAGMDPASSACATDKADEQARKPT